MEEQAIRIEKMIDGIVSNKLDKIYYWKDDRGIWFIYLPKCGAGGLRKHSITEHEDRTITVTPSILMTGHFKGEKTNRHGYLTKGIWREC